MLATAQEMCPNVLEHDSKSFQDLTSVCDNKSRIPNDFVKNLGEQTRFCIPEWSLTPIFLIVQDTLGTEITNKVNEMNLHIANHISDKVIDDVIENLSRTYKVRGFKKIYSCTILKLILPCAGPCWWCWFSEEKTFSNPWCSEGEWVFPNIICNRDFDLSK